MKKLFAVVAGPRLGGKCVKEGTLVHTTNGPKPIEKMRVGDEVFGYNADGTVSPARVTAVHDQGVQRVVDLLYANKVIATATENHRWMTSKTGRGSRVGTTSELSWRAVERRFVKHRGGNKTVPYAYAIGSLLGNGCATCGSGKRYDYSSGCEEQVDAVARNLGVSYTKASGDNYTWQLGRGDVERAIYNAWCDGRLAGQKIVDMNEVATWDRASQVALLAGLIDTDGSVSMSKKQRSFTLSFSSTSKSLATAFSELVLGLFQVEPTTRLDRREGRNDCWDVRVSSGFHVNRILSEMSEWLVTPNKKYRQEMAEFPHQRSETSVTVTLGSTYDAPCWDITIDNDTSLYLLTKEGLITHNTTIAGTLPGNTVLLQAAVLESGSRSAVALAKKRGNNLVVETFSSLPDLLSKLEFVGSSNEVDHIFIDGFSAINEMRWGQDDVQAAFKKNAFDAFGKHGDEVTKLLHKIKKFSDGANAKNIFITCALKVRTDAGATDVELEAKGKMAVTAITKLGETVVTVVMLPTEHGDRRVMITKTFEKWPGRVDGVLDQDNPGIVEPDLSIVLAMSEGTADFGDVSPASVPF